MQHKTTVLAIDDSQDILFALSAICELENWTTLTTTEGAEAAAIVRERRPDIVLVDYHMPRMDGIEVVRSIRQVDAAVPILVLTIEGQRRVADDFIAVGADDFALKPIKPVDLISRIRVHLRTSRAPGSQTAAGAAAAQAFAPAPAFARQEEYIKGINPGTLAVVLRFLEGQTEFLTIDEISKGCGLAYQTAYRYLTHLIGDATVEIYASYGRQGRPKQKYRLKQKKD